jgi:hypothetical protein
LADHWVPTAVVAIVVLLSVAGPASGIPGLLASVSAEGLPGSTSNPDPSGASAPIVGTLATFDAIAGGSNLTFEVNFTVPSGVTDVLYVWAIGGGLGTFQAPTLPHGLAIVASSMDPTSAVRYAGIANGSLSPGKYSTNLTYDGWTNTVSIVVYGVLGGSQAAYRFGSVSKANPSPGTSTVAGSLTIPAGAMDYLGAVATGGYFVASWSMSAVSAEAPAWSVPGYTEIIGTQTSGTISATTNASSVGIVGAGIYPQGPSLGAPVPVLLASSSGVAGGKDLTFPLEFTVPSGVSAVLYAWSIGGGLGTFQPPVLPLGLSIVASSMDPTSAVRYAGIANGSLSPGTYDTNLTYSGWTNTFSVAVIGILGCSSPIYRYGSTSTPNAYPGISTVGANLTLPAGAVAYLGVAATGGYELANWSMSVAEADSPAWYMPGYTEVIGAQLNSTISAYTNGSSIGVVGVGVYATAPVACAPPSSSSMSPWAWLSQPYVLAGMLAAVVAVAVVAMLWARPKRPQAMPPAGKTNAGFASPPRLT